MTTDYSTAKLQIAAIKKAVIVLSKLGQQLAENHGGAEQEIKILGQSLLWAIDELEQKYGVKP